MKTFASEARTSAAGPPARRTDESRMRQGGTLTRRLLLKVLRFAVIGMAMLAFSAALANAQVAFERIVPGSAPATSKNANHVVVQPQFYYF